MTHLPIKDIEKGTAVERQVYAIRDVEVKQGQKGSFLKGVLFDATGEAQLMWFDCPDEIHFKPVAEWFSAYQYVEVVGGGDEFKGTKQIKVDDMVGKDIVADESLYIRASKFPTNALEAKLLEIVESISDPEIGLVVAELVMENLDELLVVPAAMENHHAWRRGLAEHVVSMCLLADRVAEHYQSMYGTYQDEPVLDRDLLIAGVLLHDLGKIWDFEPDGLGFKMGQQSVLVGHIPECDARIHHACVRGGVSKRTEMRLRHMVLSHHGTKHFGSPATPALLEAQLLHQVDMLDSRFAMIRELSESLEVGEVSERSWALRGRVTR